MLNQAIINNKNQGKQTLVTAIDASKAFDKINRKHLWNKMFELPINKNINISLVSYYEDSHAIIENKNEYSKLFRTTVGAKQGGAAQFFLLYM